MISCPLVLYLTQIEKPLGTAVPPPLSREARNLALKASPNRGGAANAAEGFFELD